MSWCRGVVVSWCLLGQALGQFLLHHMRLPLPFECIASRRPAHGRDMTLLMKVKVPSTGRFHIMETVLGRSLLLRNRRPASQIQIKYTTNIKIHFKQIQNSRTFSKNLQKINWYCITYIISMIHIL